MRVLYTGEADIERKTKKREYNYVERRYVETEEEHTESGFFRLIEADFNGARNPTLRFDVFTDSDKSATRLTYDLCCTKDKKTGLYTPFITCVTSGRSSAFNPTLTMPQPYYPSLCGIVPGAGSPAGFELFSIATRRMHELYDNLPPTLPGVFSLHKWWLYNRFPGYKVLVDANAEPEFPADWPTWWQTIMKQSSLEKILKYLYGASTRAHVKHLSSFIDKPFGASVAYLCRILRGNVPPDYMLSLKPGFEVAKTEDPEQTYYNRQNVVRRAPGELNGVDKAFAGMTPKRAIRVASEALESLENWYLFLDGLQLLRNRPWPTGTKISGGVRDFHDQLTLAYNNRRAAARPAYGQRANTYTYTPPAPKEIKVNEDLDGLEIDGYKIVWPKLTTDVEAWGREQRHCLGGYANYAANGTYQIFGIYKGDKLLANIGTNTANKTLIDFRGAANSIVPLEIQKAILPVCIAHGLLGEGIGPHPLYNFQQQMSTLELLKVTQEIQDIADELKKELEKKKEAERKKKAAEAKKKKAAEAKELQPA